MLVKIDMKIDAKNAVKKEVISNPSINADTK